MCFGVRDAITLALEQSRLGPLTVLGDLVHNETVLADLAARGIRVAQHPEEVSTQRVIITAHGASEKLKAGVRERGHYLLEATCPLVHAAHRAVRRMAQEGYHPIIIGKRDHVEVRGLTEDLAEFDVVLSEEEICEIKERERFGVAAQTTQPIERVRAVVELIRRRFPNTEVRFVDTVCRPTKQRQNSAVEMAQQSDVVVVIGGAHSNNTRELVSTCSRYCGQVHHVQTSADMRSEWFGSTQTVGITAGTSTPDSLVTEVEHWLASLAASLGSPAKAAAASAETIEHLKAA